MGRIFNTYKKKNSPQTPLLSCADEYEEGYDG
jgi:hypothetical protein